MDQISSSLNNIGLSDKESKIYVTLLKLGEATVAEISTEAGIKRPTAYIILDELRKKGIALKIPHPKKIVYQAKPPNELFERAKENLNEFQRLLPKINAISVQKKSIKTLYFEGFQGVKDALFYRMNELKGETVSGFWAKNSGIEKDVFGLLDKWGKQYLKNNITIAGITPDHESIRDLRLKYPEEYKKIVPVSEAEYSSDISIDVVKDFVRIIDPHSLKAIIIENDRVARALKQIFTIVEKKYGIS